MTGLTAYLANLAATGNPVVVAEFVDACWFELVQHRPPGAQNITWNGPLRTWRTVRTRVQAALADLQLECSVFSSAEGLQTLRQHDMGVAGLVVVHRGELEGGLPWPRHEPTDAHTAAYRARMFAAHGLIPHPGLPRTLREFLGQHAGYASASWLDHVMGWLDRNGEPVLTCEPYRHGDGPGLTQEQAEEVLAGIDGLPLDLTAAEGVWNDGTVLLILRMTCDPLPAVPEPSPPPWVGRVVDDAERWKLRKAHGPLPGGRLWCEVSDEQWAELAWFVDEILHQLDEAADLQQLAATLDAAHTAVKGHLQERIKQPTRQSLNSLVAAVLAAPTSLQWAADRLYEQVLAGNLKSEPARRIVADTVAHLGRPPEHAEQTLNLAAGYVYEQVLGQTPEVAELLDADWCARTRAALDRGTAGHLAPHLARALKVRSYQLMAEAYS